MKFLELKIHNFLTITDAHLFLADRGLNLIRGENDVNTSADSNGAGKSTIADAICWVLYGKTARGMTGDKIVNLAVKKDCVVTLTIKDGDNVYEIARHRKSKAHGNTTHVHFIDPAGVGTEMHKGKESDTQLVIDKLLGANYEVFSSAIYAGQEKMPDLPGMTDGELKVIVEKGAGIDRIERAYREALKRSNTAEAAVMAIDSKLDSLNQQIARSKLQIEQQKLRKQEWSLVQGDRIAEALRAVTAAERVVDEQLAILEGMPAPEKVDQALAAIDAQLATFTALQQELKDVQQQARIASNAHVTATNALERHEKLMTSIRKQIDDIDEHMKQPCAECGKPHTVDERNHLVGVKTVQLNDLHAKMPALKEEIAVCLAAFDALSDKLSTINTALGSVSDLHTKRTGVVALQTARSRQETVVKTSRSNVETTKAAATTAREAKNPYEATIGDLITSISAVIAETKAKQVEREAAQKLMQITDDVVKVFGPAGVRAHILDTVTPFLNARTSTYLTTLSDGNLWAVWSTLSKTAKGDLKECFEITAGDDTGSDTFEGLSGGEKRKVRIATMLALQDLFGTRATKPIDLFIADEIDNALDEAGLERLMDVLESKAREKGTLLLISHSDLRDHCDLVTTVKKIGKHTSTVTGELTGKLAVAAS